MNTKQPLTGVVLILSSAGLAFVLLLNLAVYGYNHPQPAPAQQATKTMPAPRAAVIPAPVPTVARNARERVLLQLIPISLRRAVADMPVGQQRGVFDQYLRETYPGPFRQIVGDGRGRVPNSAEEREMPQPY